MVFELEGQAVRIATFCATAMAGMSCSARSDRWVARAGRRDVPTKRVSRWAVRHPLTQPAHERVSADFSYFASAMECAHHRRAKALALAGIGVPNLHDARRHGCSQSCNRDNASPVSSWRTVRGDLSIRRLLASCIRHANPHRPPPCICRWPQREVAVIPERLPDHPRLHALLGAAVLDLPAALAETLEDALRESAEFVTPSAFFAHLKGHGRNLRADGEAWSEMCLSPGRAFDMALATRSISGITALTAVLHAAHVARESDDPACCPSAAVIEGLFNACQVLSLQVERCLVP
ncbi:MULTISPECIES: hypothetical protein [Stenotrophomonas]|uniref:hypothetical protein n=1 Tax=Stenotrophomonas TaxID=40323 RepID=UPI0039C683BF